MNITAIIKTPSQLVGKTRKAITPQEHERREVALVRVAVCGSGDTKKAIVADLRAGGLAGNPVNVERVQGFRTQFEDERRQRHVNRANGRISRPVLSLPAPSGRPAILIPIGTPTERLTALRKHVVKKYAQQAFRYGAPGGTSIVVEFASQSSNVSYSVSLDRNYDVYRGAYKGWGANVDRHQISIPADWRRRVERKGIAMLGGMLTLDALPMEAPAGIELYAAVWSGQGRGYEVKTERGFIAVAGQESFHGDTAERAIACLLRKGKGASTRMAAIADIQSAVDAFIMKYSTRDIEVSLDDARKSGSCEYGIRSWCESVGIDIARVHVPMAELLEAFRRLPLIEVRRAVLHAVRQNRHCWRGR